MHRDIQDLVPVKLSHCQHQSVIVAWGRATLGYSLCATSPLESGLTVSGTQAEPTVRSGSRTRRFPSEQQPGGGFLN